MEDYLPTKFVKKMTVLSSTFETANAMQFADSVAECVSSKFSDERDDFKSTLPSSAKSTELSGDGAEFFNCLVCVFTTAAQNDLQTEAVK